MTAARPLDEAGERGGELGAGAGRAGQRDEVEPAVGAPAARRMRSSVEVGATSWTRRSLGLRSAGRSATIRLVAPAARHRRGEALPAVGLEERRVRHRHERNVDPRARLGEAVEAGARPHPLRERPLGRAADHRPVRERVGEGEAELEQVGAALDGRRGELRRLGPAHQVDRRALPSLLTSSPGISGEHLGEVLVAAAREADEHELRSGVERAGERVRAARAPG